MKNLAMFSTQVVPCVVDDLSNFCPSIRAQPPPRPLLTSCALRNLRTIFASSGDVRCNIRGSRIATASLEAIPKSERCSKAPRRPRASLDRSLYDTSHCMSPLDLFVFRHPPCSRGISILVEMAGMSKSAPWSRWLSRHAVRRPCLSYELERTKGR
jgi:hypothetical protein